METLLETAAEQSIETRADIKALRNEVRDEFTAIRLELANDKAELKELKDRGGGLLAGVALFAGAAGAGIAKAWQSLLS
jgi:hypothetical protein